MHLTSLSLLITMFHVFTTFDVFTAVEKFTALGVQVRAVVQVPLYSTLFVRSQATKHSQLAAT